MLTMPTLDLYLENHAGRKIKNLPVISAENITGVMTEVNWKDFPDKEKIDFEASWARIEWDDGTTSFTTINFLKKVKVR